MLFVEFSALLRYNSANECEIIGSLGANECAFRRNVSAWDKLPSFETISKIALCGGAGSFLIKDAMQTGADAFITGDLKYHDYFTPQNEMILADIGHYESEQFSKDLIAQLLTKKFHNFAVLKTKVNTNPVKYL